MEYRRLRGVDIWHWCKNCSKYPAKKFEERHTKPTSGKLCDECLGKEKNKKCRK
ncbi:MAG: hypothetical protein JXQ30_01835 [Spirochaetes bacterium]|nr:hypothetical protein [Spirochaetota bacterium]